MVATVGVEARMQHLDAILPRIERLAKHLHKDPDVWPSLLAPGWLAAVQAADAWEPGGRASLWTYLERPVRRAMKMALKAELGETVLSGADYQLRRRMEIECQAYLSLYGVEPGLPELARRLGVTVRVLEGLRSRMARPLRLDEPIAEADGARWVDHLQAGGDLLDDLIDQDQRLAFESAMVHLTSSQRCVLQRRLNGETLEAIALEQGVSHQAIAGRLDKVIRKLRRAIGA